MTDPPSTARDGKPALSATLISAEAHDPKPAFEARRMLAEGQLPGVAAVNVLRSRDDRGNLVVDIVALSADGGPDTVVTPARHSDFARLGTALQSGLVLPPATVKRGREELDAFLERNGRALQDSRVTISAAGVRAANGLERAHPGLVILVEALGREARVGPQRIQAGNEYDADRRLSEVLALHAKAGSVAEGRRASGAAAAIGATALNVAQECGIHLAEVLGALGWRGRVPFRSRNGAFHGWFEWRDFAVAVDLEHTKAGNVGTVSAAAVRSLRGREPDAPLAWKLRGDELTILSTRTPETAAASMLNHPLGRLVDMPLVLLDSVVASAETNSIGDLAILLEPRTVLLDSTFEPL